MKHKLLNTVIVSYLCFLLVSFTLTLVLVPRFLKHYLYQISDDPAYLAHLQSQSVAIQNVCYLLIAVIFVLSLFPVAVFYLRLYRPLNKISEAASRYIEDRTAHGTRPPRTVYDKNDELGRLNATLKYLVESANNSSEYQRKFISNISHDFRSPLTSIKGYLEAILDGTIPPELQDRYLHIVLDETERLNKLTEGLLLLNTFDDNAIYLEMTEFDLMEIIHHTADSFEGTCKKKNLSVRISPSDSSVMVYADMSRIQQVLYNLLDNAIKFSGPEKEILITVTTRKKSVFVSVKDFGTGISKENLARIWDRFYKTDSSRGRDKKGIGLGLSIVKEIIYAHGQNINVISTEGVGTEFVFTLDIPRAKKKTKTKEEYKIQLPQ